jgi:hypothetical protein
MNSKNRASRSLQVGACSGRQPRSYNTIVVFTTDNGAEAITFLRTGMIPPQLPGSPTYLKPGTPAVAVFLRDLGYGDIVHEPCTLFREAVDVGCFPDAQAIGVRPGLGGFTSGHM